VGRKHFRLLYQRHPDDTTINPEPGKTIFESATSRFGVQSIRRDNYTQKSASSDFPVLCNDGRITSSISKSSTIQRLPVASFDYVFINPEYVGEGHRWLKRNRLKILIENTNLIEEE